RRVWRAVPRASRHPQRAEAADLGGGCLDEWTPWLAGRMRIAGAIHIWLNRRGIRLRLFLDSDAGVWASRMTRPFAPAFKADEPAPLGSSARPRSGILMLVSVVGANEAVKLPVNCRSFEYCHMVGGEVLSAYRSRGSVAVGDW